MIGSLIIGLSLVYTIIWVYTLIMQTSKGRWVWFVLTLLLSPFVLIIFWILKFLKVIK